MGPGMIFQALVFGAHLSHAVELSWDVAELHYPSLPSTDVLKDLTWTQALRLEGNYGPC